MAPSKISFSFLLSSLLVVILVRKVESQNTNFVINAFTPNSPLIIYDRDAFVPPGTSFVRMTAVNASGLPLQLSVGRVLYNVPVSLWGPGRQATFETIITLEMTALPPLNTATLGHGITFFIVPLNSLSPFGGSGNNLGIYDSGTPVFAVEFDLNNEGIMNPMFQHIGININTIRSQVVTNAAMYGSRVFARVAYDVPTKEINVIVRYGNTVRELSFYFDLKAIFPQQVQIGLSASTGTQRLAFLDVYTWQFRSSMLPDPVWAHENATDIKSYVM